MKKSNNILAVKGAGNSASIPIIQQNEAEKVWSCKARFELLFCFQHVEMIDNSQMFELNNGYLICVLVAF